MKSAFVALVAVLGLTNVATADSKSAKIFQLSATGLPKAFKSAPEKLTQVLAQSFGADVSIVPIEDAADMLECSLTARTCLETIASSAAVKRILFGRIEMRGEKAVIKLTMFDTGKGETLRTFSLTGDTTQELVTALEGKLEAATEKTPPATPIEPTTTPAAPTTTTENHGPTTGTWAMITGGGIVAGAGIAILASASAMRTQARSAPTETRQDIDRLIAIEQAGKRRVELGGGMLAIGGIVATVGIIRLVMQRQSSPEKPLVEVVPEKGGATIMMTMGWR